MNTLHAITLGAAAYAGGMTAALHPRKRGERGEVSGEVLIALLLVLIAGLLLAGRDPRILIEGAIAVGLGRAGGWTAVRQKTGAKTKPKGEEDEQPQEPVTKP